MEFTGEKDRGSKAPRRRSPGIAGALGGRALAEDVFDRFGAQKMTPAEFITTSTLMFGTPEQVRSMCELRALENPSLGEYDPMCDVLIA